MENICADDKRIVNFEPDYSNANSLDNWVMRLNLTCASKFHKGALGSAFFFGWVLTLLWMPRLGDILGRSLLYRITVFVDLFMFLAVFFIKRWVPMIVVLTVIGAFTSIRYNIGYVYLLEFFPKESRPIVGSCQGILRGLIALALALYFWKINKNWIFIMAFAWLLQLFAVVSSFFVPESPRWLLAKGMRNELFEVVNRMASSNGKSITE